MKEHYFIVVNWHGLRWSNEFGWCYRPFEIYVGLDWDLPHGEGRWESLLWDEPIEKNATKILRIDGKVYELPMVLYFPGGGHYLYNVVARRKPKAGEYFISGAVPQVYLSEKDSIFTYLVVEKAEKVEHFSGWAREEE